MDHDGRDDHDVGSTPVVSLADVMEAFPGPQNEVHPLPEQEFRKIKTADTSVIWYVFTDKETRREDDAVGLEYGVENGKSGVQAVHVAIIDVLDAYTSTGADQREIADRIVKRYVSLQSDRVCVAQHEGKCRVRFERLSHPTATLVVAPPPEKPQPELVGAMAVIVRIPVGRDNPVASATIRRGVVPKCKPLTDKNFNSKDHRVCNKLLEIASAIAGLDASLDLCELDKGSPVHLSSPCVHSAGKQRNRTDTSWHVVAGDAPNQLTVSFPVRKMFSPRRFVTETLLAVFNAAALSHMVGEGKMRRNFKLMGLVPKNDESSNLQRTLNNLFKLSSYECFPNTPLLKDAVDRRIMTEPQIVFTTKEGLSQPSLVRFSPPLRSVAALHNQLQLIASLSEEQDCAFPADKNLMILTAEGLRNDETRGTSDANVDKLFESLCVTRPRVGVILSPTLTIALDRNSVHVCTTATDAKSKVFQVGGTKE